MIREKKIERERERDRPNIIDVIVTIENTFNADTVNKRRCNQIVGWLVVVVNLGFLFNFTRKLGTKPSENEIMRQAAP